MKESTPLDPMRAYLEAQRKLIDAAKDYCALETATSASLLMQKAIAFARAANPTQEGGARDLRDAALAALEAWNAWLNTTDDYPSEDWLDAMSDLEIAHAKSVPVPSVPPWECQTCGFRSEIKRECPMHGVMAYRPIQGNLTGKPAEAKYIPKKGPRGCILSNDCPYPSNHSQACVDPPEWFVPRPGPGCWLCGWPVNGAVCSNPGCLSPIPAETKEGFGTSQSSEPSAQEDEAAPVCEYCGVPEALAPAIGYYCGNKDCPDAQGTEEEQTTKRLERALKFFTNPEPLKARPVLNGEASEPTNPIPSPEIIPLEAIAEPLEAHAQAIEDAYREGFADGDSGKMPNAAWNRSMAHDAALAALAVSRSPARPMKLEAEIDPTRQPGEAHVRIFMDKETEDGSSRSYVGAFYGNAGELSQEIAYRINHFEEKE